MAKAKDDVQCKLELPTNIAPVNDRQTLAHLTRR